MVLHVKLQPQRTKPVKMRAKTVLQLKIRLVFNALFVSNVKHRYICVNDLSNSLTKMYLDKFMHANQGFLEGVKGGGVQHLLLDLCAVRAPNS